ncbi:MAG: hypothetical protein LBD41_06975, partial [Clostridiales Family XIII bacterium]|nr:hypothetical protein [Clostridiales Family XIII bacterium]
MHSYVKYCSKPCRIKAKCTQERAKKLADRKRNCKVCNKEFIAYDNKQIYCSAECRYAYKPENSKQWILRNEERYRSTGKIYRQKPEVKLKKNELMKKERDE